MTKRKSAWLIVVAVFLSLIIIFVGLCLIFVDNKNIQYEKININHSNDKGATLKIAHLSDMHFPQNRVNINGVLMRITEESPDFIAITGDLIDNGAAITKSSKVFEFIEKLVLIAPVYYVDGNHERRSSNAQELYDGLELRGVRLLQNKYEHVVINGVGVTIIGLGDSEYGPHYGEAYVHEDIGNDYVVLLAHKPSVWSSATTNQTAISPDLILSGHVHGGQIRLFGKGILCPDKFFFPKFQSGLYTSSNERGSKMVVSRGIGNSIVPFRFNNKPHIPIIAVSL